MTRFEAELGKHAFALRRSRLQTLQVNVGRKCNQTCRHCHVDAAPWRTEMMDAKTAWRVAAWIERHRPPVVDITGGAPELSEYFRFLVEVSRGCDCHVIDRNNLTIIETGAFGWLPEYLAEHEVEVVASLPCYLEENVDAQRGNGVFEKSIRALRKLNAVGYGRRLPLNLVYNPLGPKLPPPQAELEADYKTELGRRYGIKFTRLYTITNQPINRFAQDLREHDQWDAYLELLANSFNPATVESLMCRSTLSVGWRGELYDCDFNQMLEMQIRNGDGAGTASSPSGHLQKESHGARTASSPSNYYKQEKENHGDEAVPAPLYLWEVTPEQLEGREIQTGVHCLACTAGCGSSCTGAVAEAASAAAVA